MPDNKPKPQSIPWQSLGPSVHYANRLQCLPGFAFGPRIIEEHQFIFVAAGKGIAWIQGDCYNASPGCLFYYGPDTVHHFIADEAEPFLLYGLHFSWLPVLAHEHRGSGLIIRDAKFDPVIDTKKDNRMLIGDENGQSPDCLLIGDVRQLSAQRFEPRFIRLAEAYSMEEREFKQPLLSGLLLELIAAIKQHEVREISSKTTSPLISAISKKLTEHACERYNHGWLGEWSAYHPDHIARLFRSELGMTPHDFFMACKLQLAKELLTHSELSLLAIADELGTGTIHNFTKWFKQHAGMPPGRFRKQSRFI
ncbi:AraC family transcriptional regulator [Paenibacillus sp. OV219]|uniref:AraC family transcriptional regulator n=1 Tax=Paenibacillus sp. OV219 TaxID=1884377 RepID=UPI0008AB2229|nr:AraC family transcriptional regulator [Paenibacillus sp. OV219]SEP12879.1 AraC-type DNA-binding protein [Paenibacillus sp. OV219]